MNLPPQPGQQPPPPPPPSLSSTLSSLTQLLKLTNQCLSTSPNPNFTPQTQNLITCPFNPNHIIPPESLFSHSLKCPPPPLNLTSLNYQNTLQSSTELRRTQNEFVQKIEDPDVEICYDLDEFITFGSNFFYKECPGVVSSIDLDIVKKTLTLPGFLLVECENFVGVDEGSEDKGIGELGFKLLASDLWEVRREIEIWGDFDFPREYSSNVCSVILGLDLRKACEFKRWVIENSVQYGVVIDVYLRDHVSVLLCLCLKAIITEARNSLKNASFKCPVLVRVFMWLSSQLSILYGELNGKYFALGMLKYCLLESSSGLLLFRSDQKATGCVVSRQGDESLDTNDVKLEEYEDRSMENQKDESVDESVDENVVSCMVYLSQVAASVAALHERSMLEEKIKALRFPQPLYAYQRMAEHNYMSKRAYEERKNRSNYKPIIDHDGLPRKHLGNQVTRDIIEEFMEEIKLAGGIGCFVKQGDNEEGTITSESRYSEDVTTEFEQLAEKISNDNIGVISDPKQVALLGKLSLTELLSSTKKMPLRFAI
ncbi:hypothetical protein ACFE04_023242 [Oxalis oulophora]